MYVILRGRRVLLPLAFSILFVSSYVSVSVSAHRLVHGAGLELDRVRREHVAPAPTQQDATVERAAAAKHPGPMPTGTTEAAAVTRDAELLEPKQYSSRMSTT